tara:strand:+ start:157 stop:1323 length:1167 start_codon:yes stop_codon:yes gene_type:complete
MNSDVEKTLPEGWKYVQLGDLSEYINGYTFKSKDWSNKGLPIIRIQNLNGKDEYNYFESEIKEKYKVFNGDILISWSASLDVYYWQGGDAVLNQHIFNTKINTEIITKEFFYHTIKYSLAEISRNLHGMGLKHITKGKFERILSPLPPIEEQKRIVTKIDTLFAKIDKSITLTEESIVQAKNLFTSSLSEIFNELKSSYKTYPLMKYVNFVGGSQPPKSTFSYEKKKGYVRLIQIRDYKTDNHIVYINENSTKKFCEKNDIMIGRYGPPVFQILRGLKGAYNVALMKAIPIESKVDSEFLFYFLQNSNIQRYIISISQRSAGQSGVNKKALDAYSISLPPLGVQTKLVVVFNQLKNHTQQTQSKLEEQLAYLKQLKSSILSKAFKGEL